MAEIETPLTGGNGRYEAGLWNRPLKAAKQGQGAAERIAWIGGETAVCERCALCRGRRQTVCGTGPADAELMVAGERPGADEDECGRPFSGPAGDLLEKMLRAIGQSRRRVFLTNAVRCRPPHDREPETDELIECRAYLLAEIEAVRPAVVAAAGAVPAHVLLNDDSQPIGKLRGRIFRLHGTLVVPTWNPAYLLRRPAAKAEAWQDLKTIRKLLAGARQARNGIGGPRA